MKKCADCGAAISRRARALCQSCYLRAQRGHVQIPKAPFQRFLYDAWRGSGRGLHSFGREVLGVTTFPELIKDDHQPSQATYDKLRKHFGEDLPTTQTDTEARRHRMRAVRVQPRMGGRNGTRQSPEARARKKARWAALSPDERRHRTAPSHQPAIQTLRVYLRHTPQPTEGLVRQWATISARKLALPVQTILSAWGRQLRRQGITVKVPPLSKAGRSWSVADSKAETIRRLHGRGQTRQQIIAEGARRELEDGTGWGESYVDETLSKHRRRSSTLQS